MAHIWVPKLKIHEVGISTPSGRVEGYFVLETVNRHGRVTQRLGPWRQVVTNLQMDDMFYFDNTSGGHAWCAVGTGSPTFTNGSTGLANPVATTSTAYSSSTTVDTAGTAGYRETHTITKAFALGAIAANLTEVGMFSANNNTSARFLDLIRDSGGNPTAFPVTSDDQLRVTHIVYRYPTLDTFAGSFVIGGPAGSGTHDYELNMAGLGSSIVAGSGWGGTFGCANNSGQAWDCYALRDCTDLGTVLAQTPTGAVILGPQSSTSGGAHGTASNDGTVWRRTKTFTWGLTTANHANGISGFKFGDPAQLNRCYKMIVDPPIPKFAGSVQRILSIEFSVGITRP
jgi:hypothetical protein